MEGDKIIEIVQRLSSIEKAVNNGLREDIAEIKQNIQELHASIVELKQGFSSLRALQNAQWFIIASILTALIGLFVKR